MFTYSSVVPIIAVSLHTFPSGVDLYEETYIDLVCDPSITEVIDTEVDISFTWTGHDSNGESIDTGGGEGYTISDQSDNSTLRIEQLSISRDNMAVYSCLVNVTPILGSVYILGSESNMGDITLNVNRKLLTNEWCLKVLLMIWYLVLVFHCIIPVDLLLTILFPRSPT